MPADPIAYNLPADAVVLYRRADVPPRRAPTPNDPGVYFRLTGPVNAPRKFWLSLSQVDLAEMGTQMDLAGLAGLLRHRLEQNSEMTFRVTDEFSAADDDRAEFQRQVLSMLTQLLAARADPGEEDGGEVQPGVGVSPGSPAEMGFEVHREPEQQSLTERAFGELVKLARHMKSPADGPGQLASRLGRFDGALHMYCRLTGNDWTPTSRAVRAAAKEEQS